MEQILETANNFSPIGVITLFLFIVFYIIKGYNDLIRIKNNHLPHIQNSSENNGERLLLIGEGIRETNETLKRVEYQLAQHVTDEMRVLHDIHNKVSK